MMGKAEIGKPESGNRRRDHRERRTTELTHHKRREEEQERCEDDLTEDGPGDKVVSVRGGVIKTARPENRIGWNDPRTVSSAQNKIVVWSTDDGANRTEYDLLKYSDLPYIFYTITQRQSWNADYPIEDALTDDLLTKNPVHDLASKEWDFKVWYGPTAGNSEETGPYEIYAISDIDYTVAVGVYSSAIIGALKDWADAVYKRFRDGDWSGSDMELHPTSVSSVSFIAEQPEENVPYADLTHKFGATSLTSLPEIALNGRRYPQTLATVPVYCWSTNTPVNEAFLGDSRVEDVIRAFLEQIPHDELNTYYEASSETGTIRTIQWEFSMADHHQLYWAEDAAISLTGGNDTLLRLNPINQDPLALGDVWVVGSDPANQLYGGGGHIELTVEKLPSDDLKIHADPTVNMTVEDMFDFNYWNGDLGPASAASIQCAHGREGTGVGQAALLRFDVSGDVENTGDIDVPQP